MSQDSQDTSNPRSNVSISRETLAALSKLSDRAGRPISKVISAIVLAPEDVLLKIVKDGLERLDAERKRGREAAKREQEVLKNKLSHLTPAQLEALIAQAEKLK